MTRPLWLLISFLWAGTALAAKPIKPMTGPSLAEVFNGQRQGLDACYQQAQTSRPDLRVRAEVSLVVEGGKAGKIQLRDVNLPELQACLETQLKAMTFPASMEGLASTIPLHFPRSR